MKNGIADEHDPEKVESDNLLFSGRIDKASGALTVQNLSNSGGFDPSFVPASGNRLIRVDVRFAPVVKPERRLKSAGGSMYQNVRHESQAARCMVCGSLIAVGNSFNDHVHFCRQVQP